MYSKRDLNPHSRCRPRDFKSLVSTIPPFEPQIWVLGAEDGTRIRDPNLGKVVLYQLSYFRNNVNARFTSVKAAAKIYAISFLQNEAMKMVGAYSF